MPVLTPRNTVIILKPTVGGPGHFGLLWNPTFMTVDFQRHNIRRFGGKRNPRQGCFIYVVN